MRLVCPCQDQDLNADPKRQEQQMYVLIFARIDNTMGQYRTYLCAIMSTVMFPCKIIRSMDCCTV